MKWILTIILSLALFSGCATIRVSKAVVKAQCSDAVRIKEIYTHLPPSIKHKCFYADNSVSIYVNGIYQYNRPRFGYEKAPSKDNQWSDFGTFNLDGIGMQDNRRRYKQKYNNNSMPSGSARGPYYGEWGKNNKNH